MKIVTPEFINPGVLSYNVFSGIAYLVAMSFFYLEVRRKQIPLEVILGILFGSLLGALIGSKLGSALFVYWEYFSENFLQIFSPQLGGKTLVGGLIGGYAGVVIAKKILKFKRSTGDLFAPGVAIGIAIGRIGCFLNGCCHGIATGLPWGVNIAGVIRHPTQIYESIFCLILFIYLWAIRKKNRVEGDLFKVFLFAYAFFRFWIEFLRADTVIWAYNLSMAQVIAGVVVIIYLVYFLRSRQLRGASDGKKDL